MKSKISLLFLLVMLAETSIERFLNWFTASLTEWFIPLILMIFVLMFFFAILKAPLDILKKQAVQIATLLVLAQSSTDIVTNLGGVFFALLGVLITFVLPLILILMIYKAFMALVKS